MGANLAKLCLVFVYRHFRPEAAVKRVPVFGGFKPSQVVVCGFSHSTLKAFVAAAGGGEEHVLEHTEFPFGGVKLQRDRMALSWKCHQNALVVIV